MRAAPALQAGAAQALDQRELHVRLARSSLRRKVSVCLLTVLDFGTSVSPNIDIILSHLRALQVGYLLVGEDRLRQRRVEAARDARALAGLVQERHLHPVDHQRRLRAARPAEGGSQVIRNLVMFSNHLITSPNMVALKLLRPLQCPKEEGGPGQLTVGLD